MYVYVYMPTIEEPPLSFLQASCSDVMTCGGTGACGTPPACAAAPLPRLTRCSSCWKVRQRHEFSKTSTSCRPSPHCSPRNCRILRCTTTLLSPSSGRSDTTRSRSRESTYIVLVVIVIIMIIIIIVTHIIYIYIYVYNII